MFFREILAMAPGLGEFITTMPPHLDGRFAVQKYPPFSIIHQKESVLERIGILLDGSFRVINEFENGNVFMIENNTPISFVGEITLFAKRNITSVTLESVTECTIAFLPVDIFSAWIDTDIHFMRMMTEHIASKLYVSSYNRGERLFYSSPYIFLKYLVRWAKREGVAEKPAVINLTRREMSEILGLQEKTINRIITKLENEGCITLEKGKIHITAEQCRDIVRNLPSYRAKSRNGA